MRPARGRPPTAQPPEAPVHARMRAQAGVHARMRAQAGARRNHTRPSVHRGSVCVASGRLRGRACPRKVFHPMFRTPFLSPGEAWADEGGVATLGEVPLGPVEPEGQADQAKCCSSSDCCEIECLEDVEAFFHKKMTDGLEHFDFEAQTILAERLSKKEYDDRMVGFAFKFLGESCICQAETLAKHREVKSHRDTVRLSDFEVCKAPELVGFRLNRHKLRKAADQFRTGTLTFAAPKEHQVGRFKEGKTTEAQRRDLAEAIGS